MQKKSNTLILKLPHRAVKDEKGGGCWKTLIPRTQAADGYPNLLGGKGGLELLKTSSSGKKGAAKKKKPSIGVRPTSTGERGSACATPLCGGSYHSRDLRNGGQRKMSSNEGEAPLGTCRKTTMRGEREERRTCHKGRRRQAAKTAGSKKQGETTAERRTETLTGRPTKEKDRPDAGTHNPRQKGGSKEKVLATPERKQPNY